MPWWPLGSAGVGAWLFPCDLIGHTHRSHERPCGISHTHKRRDTTIWHKDGVDHTHFCLIIECNACYSFDD